MPWNPAEHPSDQRTQRFIVKPVSGSGQHLDDPADAGLTGRQRCVAYAKRHVIDMMWHTAGIEIRGITFPETEQIFHGTVPYTVERRNVMVVNNIKHAWQFLFDNTDWLPDLQYAQEYNRLICSDLEPQPGVVRTIPVAISGTDYVPSVPTGDAIRAAFHEAAGLDDPVDRALMLFDRCSREQWFANGNKRTATMLANHSLIHDGAGVLAIPPDLVELDFKDLLLDYYETNDARKLDRWLKEHAISTRLG